MRIETERETDGRWIAEVMDIPGSMSYGETEAEAINLAKAIALRAIADRLEHGEVVPDLIGLFNAEAA